ncbi:MAG: hypothetical protein Q9227_002726 [Pyrenula ochraceoflavens]
MALAPLYHTLQNLLYTPSNPTIPFPNKTILITGANSGIGYTASLKYLQLGCARLILAVRSLRKGEEARIRLLEELGDDGRGGEERVVVREVDMASFASVGAFAEKVSKEEGRVDVVVLNAGVAVTEWKGTGDGWEESLQVNVLGSALLGCLLLPKLVETGSRFYDEGDGEGEGEEGRPTLTFVTSIMHRYVGRRDLREGSEKGGILRGLSDRERWVWQEQYPTTKVLEEFVMRSLARAPGLRDEEGKRVKVVVNSVCPGLVWTPIFRNLTDEGSRGRGWFEWVAPWVMRTAEQGGRQLVTASAWGVESHGRWILNDGFAWEGRLLVGERGEELRRKVWREVMDVLDGWIGEDVKELIGEGIDTKDTS